MGPHRRTTALARLWAAGTLLVAGAAAAQEVKRTELGRSPVSGDEGREIVMQLVEIPPGATSRRHFHNGKEAFYVLEGALAQARVRRRRSAPPANAGSTGAAFPMPATRSSVTGP